MRPVTVGATLVVAQIMAMNQAGLFSEQSLKRWYAKTLNHTWLLITNHQLIFEADASYALIIHANFPNVHCRTPIKSGIGAESHLHCSQPPSRGCPSGHFPRQSAPGDGGLLELLGANVSLLPQCKIRVLAASVAIPVSRARLGGGRAVAIRGRRRVDAAHRGSARRVWGWYSGGCPLLQSTGTHRLRP